MNKSELIDKVAASADIPKAVAGRALDAVIESITGALKEGDSVVLVGFGTFAVKDRAARTGRNPQTGNPIEIAAAKSPALKRVKLLKTLLTTKCLLHVSYYTDVQGTYQ